MDRVLLEDRMYTYGELKESIFPEESYSWIGFEGSFTGTLDARTWGAKKLKASIVAYVELDDGRRVKFTCWQMRDPEYLGVRDIPLGSKVSVTFEASGRNNRIIAKRVDVIS